MSNTNISELADQVDVVLLDVDGTLYHPKSPFATGLYDQIAANWNEMAFRDSDLENELLMQLGEDQGIIGPEGVQSAQLAQAYLAMIRAIIEIGNRMGGPDHSSRLLDMLYGDNHRTLIPADPELVEAVRAGREKGIQFIIDSNGPAPHTRRVLDALGFAPLEVSRIFREACFGVENAIEIGLQKKDAGHFQAMMDDIGVSTPLKRVALFDDKLAHIDTAISEGLKGVWVRSADLCSIGPSPDDVDVAREHGAYVVNNLGRSLALFVEAHPGVR